MSFGLNPFQVCCRPPDDRESDDFWDTITVVPPNQGFEFRESVQGGFDDKETFILHLDLISQRKID